MVDMSEIFARFYEALKSKGLRPCLRRFPVHQLRRFYEALKSKGLRRTHCNEDVLCGEVFMKP